MKSKEILLRPLMAGFFILLATAYIDCVRGPLMPLLKGAFFLSHTQLGIFLVIGFLAAIGCTISLFTILRFFDERRVAILAATLGILTCTFTHFVDNYPKLLVLAVLLGGVISMGGTLCNLFIISSSPQKLHSRLLCALHVMYPLGALLTPIVTANFLEKNLPWSLTMGGFPALFFFFVLMLMFKKSSTPTADQSKIEFPKLSRVHIVILLTFSTYVATEVLTTMWLVSYLHEYKGLSIVEGAPYLTGFFLVMGLTRLACFLSLKEKYEKTLLLGSLLGGLFCLLMGHFGFLWGFALAGIFGPYFPLLLGRIGRAFPIHFKALSIWAILFMQVSLGISNLVFGRLTDQIHIENSFYLPFLIGLIAIALLTIYFEWERRIYFRSLTNTPNHSENF